MIAFAAERDLAHRDPAVPGLATVCDPEAFLAALRRATLADVRDGQLRYLRYKVHTLCRASYRLDVEGEVVDLDVRACRPEDLPALLAEDGAQWLTPGPLGLGRILLADCAVVITVFPNDLKLPTLRHLVDPDERALVLQETLPERPDLWDGALHGLAYRPERRYVAEVRPGGSGRSVVLKAYTRRAYTRSKHTATAFASRGPLHLAALLGCSDARRLIVYDWLPGATLLAAFAAPELERDVVAKTGAALATLHEQQPKGLPLWTREDEADAVADVAEEIGFVCPSLARRAELLAQRIGAELASAPPLSSPMHGDFSAAQVLVAPRPGGASRVAIIDLDGACCGDPVDDLGNLLGQAERQVLDGAHTAGWLEEFTESLLDGYSRASGRPLPDWIRLYTAWSLFRKARLPFRTRAPAWQESTEALVERAETVALESGRRLHREPVSLRQ